MDSVAVVLDDQEVVGALLGAMALLSDRLIWDETQHEGGCWHITVSLEGFDWFGNDGHLLSTDRTEGRLHAFAMLMDLYREHAAEVSEGGVEERPGLGGPSLVDLFGQEAVDAWLRSNETPPADG